MSRLLRLLRSEIGFDGASSFYDPYTDFLSIDNRLSEENYIGPEATIPLSLSFAHEHMHWAQYNHTTFGSLVFTLNKLRSQFVLDLFEGLNGKDREILSLGKRLEIGSSLNDLAEIPNAGGHLSRNGWDSLRQTTRDWNLVARAHAFFEFGDLSEADHPTMIQSVMRSLQLSRTALDQAVEGFERIDPSWNTDEISPDIENCLASGFCTRDLLELGAVCHEFIMGYGHEDSMSYYESRFKALERTNYLTAFIQFCEITGYQASPTTLADLSPELLSLVEFALNPLIPPFFQSNGESPDQDTFGRPRKLSDIYPPARFIFASHHHRTKRILPVFLVGCQYPGVYSAMCDLGLVKNKLTESSYPIGYATHFPLKRREVVSKFEAALCDPENEDFFGDKETPTYFQVLSWESRSSERVHYNFAAHEKEAVKVSGPTVVSELGYDLSFSVGKLNCKNGLLHNKTINFRHQQYMLDDVLHSIERPSVCSPSLELHGADLSEHILAIMFRFDEDFDVDLFDRYNEALHWSTPHIKSNAQGMEVLSPANSYVGRVREEFGSEMWTMQGKPPL